MEKEQKDQMPAAAREILREKMIEELVERGWRINEMKRLERAMDAAGNIPQSHTVH